VATAAFCRSASAWQYLVRVRVRVRLRVRVRVRVVGRVGVRGRGRGWGRGRGRGRARVRAVPYGGIGVGQAGGLRVVVDDALAARARLRDGRGGHPDCQLRPGEG